LEEALSSQELEELQWCVLEIDTNTTIDNTWLSTKWPLLFLMMHHQGCWGTAGIFWKWSWLELKFHTSESLF